MTGYRADIDGLRAIAVLAVIFFHADFTLFKGGFTGVDVFFVISGYLITGILKRELAAGNFSFARFYERRARRILPALLLVIAVTLLACAAVMMPADVPPVARSAVSVLVFAANIMFWRGIDFGDVTLVNYFGRRIHEQPLVHTWSLGVEEQYYLLFPISLWLVWKVSRSLALPALMAVFMASLAASVWLTPNSPGVAFYLLPTRGWELLAGGLLAWRGPSLPAGRSAWRETAAVIGLLMVLAAAIVLDSSTPFPGYAAMLPVAGAVLLLHYAPGTTTGALLSRRPLVFVGLISYSAYLWHQPLFAFTRYLSLDGQIATSAALLLCAVTLGLAAGSWRYVETPFRDRTRVSRSRLAWCLGTATIAVAVPAAVAAFAGPAGRRVPIHTNIVAQSAFSMFADCSIASVAQRFGIGCLTDPESSAAPSFLVVGDSHADSLFPAFAKISRDLPMQGRMLNHSACSPLLEVTEVPSSTPACLATRDRALQMVSEEGFRTVFLVSRFSFAYGTPGLLESRLDRTIEAYADRGATVYLVAQAPEQPAFQRRIYWRAVLKQRFLGIDASPLIEAMSTTREQHDRQQADARSAFARYRDDTRVRVIDFSAALCGGERCAIGTATEPYYNDDQHLTPAGALLVSGEIARQADFAPPK